MIPPLTHIPHPPGFDNSNFLGQILAHWNTTPRYVFIVHEEVRKHCLPVEKDMSLIPHEIEAYQVQHLPLVKAYADKIGLVEVVNQLVPTEMEVDAGTIVLGMVLDTL